MRKAEKIEGTLTPTEIVLRWLAEAHAYDDLVAYTQALMSAEPPTAPLDRLASNGGRPSDRSSWRSFQTALLRHLAHGRHGLGPPNLNKANRPTGYLRLMDPTVALIHEIKRRYVAGELLKASASRQITIGLSERSRPVEDGDVFLLEPDAYLVSNVKTEGNVQTALLWRLRSRSEPEPEG